MKLKGLCLLLLTTLISACANMGTKEGLSESAYYDTAVSYMESRNFTSAVDTLRELQARFPFGDFSAQVRLDLIYSLYQQEQWDQVQFEAKSFSRLYSQHPDRDYADFSYAAALFAETEGMGELGGWVNLADRDTLQLQSAVEQLTLFVAQYPQSEYSAQARSLIDIGIDRLGLNEFRTAVFYYERKAWLSAIGRAETLLKVYPTHNKQEEAIALLSRAYRQLGDNHQADAYQALLAKNYPESTFLDIEIDTFKWTKPWYYWLSFGIIG